MESECCENTHALEKKLSSERRQVRAAPSHLQWAAFRDFCPSLHRVAGFGTGNAMLAQLQLLSFLSEKSSFELHNSEKHISTSARTLSPCGRLR